MTNDASLPPDGESYASAAASMVTLGALGPSLLQWLPVGVSTVQVPVDRTAETLLLLVELACAKADAGRGLVDRISRMAVTDVEAALHAGALDAGEAAAARLAACARATGLARYEGDLEAVWTWVITALGGTDEPTTAFETTAFTVLAARALAGSTEAQDLLGYLAADIFYTDQHAGYFPVLLDQVANVLLTVLLSSPASSPAACEGAAAALYWTRQTGGRAGHLAALARWCAHAAPMQQQADAAVQLSFAVGVALPADAKPMYFAQLLERLPPAACDELRAAPTGPCRLGRA